MVRIKVNNPTRVIDFLFLQRNPSSDEISQLRQRVRELSDALAKEEEKKTLVVAKNSLMERHNKLGEEVAYA
jgi:AmiR/NasT family two-component response regulator